MANATFFFASLSNIEFSLSQNLHTFFKSLQFLMVKHMQELEKTYAIVFLRSLFYLSVSATSVLVKGVYDGEKRV